MVQNGPGAIVNYADTLLLAVSPLALVALTSFAPRTAHQFFARAGRDLNTRSDVLTALRATSLRSNPAGYVCTAHELFAVQNGPGAI